MEAVDNTTKQVKAPYKLIHIQGGDMAVSYLPSLPELKGTAAVIDLAILQKIVAGIRAVGTVEDIAYRFMERVKSAEPSTMKEYLTLLKDELLFHTTCEAVINTDSEKAHEDIARAEEIDKNLHVEM